MLHGVKCGVLLQVATLAMVVLIGDTCLPVCEAGKSGGRYAICGTNGVTYTCQTILDCTNSMRELEGKRSVDVAYEGRCIRDGGEPLEEGDVCFTTFDEDGLFCKDVVSPLNFTYGNNTSGVAPESNYTKNCVPPVAVEWCFLVDATGQKVGLQCFRWGHCAMRSDGCCEYECVETGETTVTTTATSTPITECDNCDTTATTTQTSTPTTTEEEEEEEEHKSKAGVAAGVTIVILLLLGGGSAFYYRKTHGTGPPSSSKRKGKRKGSSGGQTNMENPLYGNEKGASEI
eukprot:gene16843-27201_t